MNVRYQKRRKRSLMSPSGSDRPRCTGGQIEIPPSASPDRTGYGGGSFKAGITNVEFIRIHQAFLRKRGAPEVSRRAVVDGGKDHESMSTACDPSAGQGNHWQPATPQNQVD